MKWELHGYGIWRSGSHVSWILVHKVEVKSHPTANLTVNSIAPIAVQMRNTTNKNIFAFDISEQDLLPSLFVEYAE